MSIFSDIEDSIDRFFENHFLEILGYGLVGYLFYKNLEKPNEYRRGYDEDYFMKK